MWSTNYSFRAATLTGRSSLRCTDFYVHGSGGEDTLQEAVLSSNHTGPGDWTRVTRLGCQHPDQLRHLTEPSLLFLFFYVLDKRFLCKAETKQKVWTFLLETRSGYTDIAVCTNAGLHGIPPAHSCGLTLHAPEGSVPPYTTLSTLLPQRAKLQSWGDNLQWAVKKATLGETVPHKTTDSQAVDEWQPFICIILDPQSADMLL